MISFLFQKKVLWVTREYGSMRRYIFNDRERRILEAYLTKTDVDKTALSSLLNMIKKEKILFEDVFLYLQVRKTITSWKSLLTELKTSSARDENLSIIKENETPSILIKVIF